MTTRYALALVLALGGCCRPIALQQDLLVGGNNGPKPPADIDGLIDALRALPLAYSPPGKPVAGSTDKAGDFLHLFFDRAYDPRLVDLVYFADVDQTWKQGATIRAAMTRGTERPHILPDEQQAWALVMIAAPATGCFAAHVNFETIAPPQSPTEAGILVAIAALTKLSSSSAATKPQGTQTDLLVPNKACYDAWRAQPVGPHDDKSAPAFPPQGAAALRFVGDAKDGRQLWAGLFRIELATATTNRVVVSVRTFDDTNAEPQTSGVITFRNASRPHFAATVGLGGRFELQGVHTTSESTEPGHPYDPDLYVMAHYLLPHAADWQLDREWYPSLFVGTNLVAQSPLNDIVGGVRIPFLWKSGFDLGADWSKYTFNVMPGCTSSCATRSAHHWGLFFGFDYEL